MDVSDKRLAGSCMCGSVQYEVSGKVRDAIACHCIECRKSSGHYTVATATRPENFVLLKQDGLKWYRSSETAQRGFCSHCGSTLFWKPDSGNRISFYAGSIDGESGLSLTAHIFLDEKGDYYEVDDGVPCFGLAGVKLEV